MPPHQDQAMRAPARKDVINTANVQRDQHRDREKNREAVRDREGDRERDSQGKREGDRERKREGWGRRKTNTHTHYWATGPM